MVVVVCVGAGGGEPGAGGRLLFGGTYQYCPNRVVPLSPPPRGRCRFHSNRFLETHMKLP